MSCAARRRASRPGDLLGGRAACAGGIRRLSSASCRSWRCAAGTARPPFIPWSRTTTAGASCAGPWPRRRASPPTCRPGRATTRHAILQGLDYVGVLAIEFFQRGDRLLANEMAPRVHNSGHWTIEGAETSQFENHLRAVGRLAARLDGAGRPCGDAEPDRHARRTLRRCWRCRAPHLHLYGKAPRPGRKLGHVTLRAADAQEALRRLAAARQVVGD